MKNFCRHHDIFAVDDSFHCGVCDYSMGRAFNLLAKEHALVDELLVAIEAAEQDIGGSRPATEIIKDLGAQWEEANRSFATRPAGAAESARFHQTGRPPR